MYLGLALTLVNVHGGSPQHSPRCWCEDYRCVSMELTGMLACLYLVVQHDETKDDQTTLIVIDG